jgi:hypothetical protein
VGYCMQKTMRPALERLLSRPSSLDLLRCLAGFPLPATSSCRTRPTRKCTSRSFQRRSYGANSFKLIPSESLGAQGIQDDFCNSASEPQLDISHRQVEMKPDDRQQISPSEDTIFKTRRFKEEDFTNDQLKYESNVDEPPGATARLIDDPVHGVDMSLWSILMKFRLEQHGLEGARAVWDQIALRRLPLPVKGKLADSLWIPILKLGFQDLASGSLSGLRSICGYANELCDVTGHRWPRLYSLIIQYVLLNGHGPSARFWHDLLYDRHPPAPMAFQNLMRNVVRGGDLEALKEIYLLNEHRKSYAKVIDTLMEQKKFSAALDWHMFFLKNGEKPRNMKPIQKLLNHYLYDSDISRDLLTSLSEIGTDLHNKDTVLQRIFDEQDVAVKKLTPTAISRETMNRVHGVAFGIGVKSYNDEWGARWFATKWINLDIAISTVHALGISEIGPLSLQSIAIREGTPEGIMRRITQLKELGISTGKSVFSKAVISFSQNRQDHFLKCLLESDQHPDTLENSALQEMLLASYILNGNSAEYQLTLAIRLAVAAQPEVEEYNIKLRASITRKDRVEVLRILEIMRMSKIPVEVVSTQYLARTLLRKRRSGRRPVSVSELDDDGDDLNFVITVYKYILDNGGWIPVYFWRELVIRLGMTGKLSEAQSLWLYLADWYNLESTTKSRVSSSTTTGNSLDRLGHLDQINLPNYDPVHPLRMLFNDNTISAIIAWGYMHTFVYRPSIARPFRVRLNMETESGDLVHKCHRGLIFVRKLSKLGIFIPPGVVQRALYVRLEVLYGPGLSSKPYNRRNRTSNPLSLREMVTQMHKAWGEPIFHDFEKLEKRISNTRKGAVAKLGWKERLRQKRLDEMQEANCEENTSLSVGESAEIYDHEC